MAIAYILIRTKPGHERDVYYRLHEMNGIREVHPVLGNFSLIVKIKAENFEKLGYILLNNINHVEDIDSSIMLHEIQF